MSPVDVNVDATLVAVDGVTSRPVRVGDAASDFHVNQTAGAKESTLQSLLAELAQKLEPADLAALATAAKQDTAQTTLASILASVDGLEGFTDGIEGALSTLNGKDFATAAAQTTAQASLSQIATALDNRYGGGLTPFAAQVTASGNTTILTPTTGKKLDVRWVTALNDPDQTNAPRIIVKFAGGLELYRSYAIAHWEKFVGATNEALVVNLDQAGDVAVTIHYKEI